MPQIAPPWTEDPNHPDWPTSKVTDKILGVAEDGEGRGKPIPPEWTRLSARRLQDVRKALKDAYVALDTEFGHLVDWLLAGLIARENVLLLGPPGVAKTEIAERAFFLLGLDRAKVDDKLPKLPGEDEDFQTWWIRRAKDERAKHKYFRYLLSRFTQPEELFGPIEISLLRRGMLVHVNFGLLTSPGVRAAFLDEVFKGSSSILNSLLTLILEREYFNWGGMMPADLLFLVGASNELPGGFGAGSVGVVGGTEDFNTLYAFLDRFPVRLEIPNASGTDTDKKPEDSALAQATDLACRREAERFSTGSAFRPTVWTDRAPCVNDVLLLGRAVLEQDFLLEGAAELFRREALGRFRAELYKAGASFQQDGTGVRGGDIRWTVSPRKLKALRKIALAHALLCDDDFAKSGSVLRGPGSEDLAVLAWIWDSNNAREELQTRMRVALRQYPPPP